MTQLCRVTRSDDTVVPCDQKWCHNCAVWPKETSQLCSATRSDVTVAQCDQKWCHSCAVWREVTSQLCSLTREDATVGQCDQLKWLIYSDHMSERSVWGWVTSCRDLEVESEQIEEVVKWLDKLKCGLENGILFFWKLPSDSINWERQNDKHEFLKKK